MIYTMSYAPFLSEQALITNDFLFHPDSNLTLEKTSSSSRRKKSSGRNSSRKKSKRVAKNFPLIVHCHLCWDWVWQRPQQFISRLSLRHPVLFVETIAPDPELASPVARFRTSPGFPNI